MVPFLTALSWRPFGGACLALALGAPFQGTGWRRLNAPLPGASLGDVKDFQLVPGQDRVVYLADQDVDETFELYSRELRPFAPSIRLHPFLGFQKDVLPGFEVDPTGRRVLYTTLEAVFFQSHFSVLVDGSAPPVQFVPVGTVSPDGERIVYTEGSSSSSHPNRILSRAIDLSGPAAQLSGPFDPLRQILDHAITSDSARVVFLGDPVAFGHFEVFSVPIDGSAPKITLSALPPDRNATDFRVSADGRLVVYRADQDARNRLELFRAPVDGSAAPVKVTPPLSAGISISANYRLTPDATGLVFLADLETRGRRELYLTPLAGPPLARKLSPPLLPGGSIGTDLRISADSRRVLYPADPEGDGVAELYSTTLDTPTPPVRLFALAPGETLLRHELAADPARVVFSLASPRRELFSVPLDGSAPPVRLHPALVAGGDVVRFELAGANVIYRADEDIDETFELFSVPIDGSAAPVRLHAPLAPERGVLPDFRVAADGRTVGFLADIAGDERFELFAGPSDGSRPAERASDPAAARAVPTGDVIAMFQADDRVVYLADQDADDVFEVFSVPLDGSHGPTRLHLPPVAGGDASFPRLAGDRKHVVFFGDLDTDGLRELYGAPVDGSAPARKLNPALAPGDGVDYALVPSAGPWVAFVADAQQNGRSELLSARVDGNAPAVRLDPPPHKTFGEVRWAELAPDGQHVVFGSDRTQRGRFEVYSVPIDGSAPAARLSHIVAQGGDAASALVSPDSHWVAYVADQDVNDAVELYGVPLDGSAPPVKLNPPLFGQRHVDDFQISAGNRVIFRVNQQLYSAPIDGSAPARLFLPFSVKVTGYWLTPLGTRVLIEAPGIGPGGFLGYPFALYAAPVDAAQPPVQLPGAFLAPVNQRVHFPDEDTLVFGGEFGTFRSPLDGSQPAALIDASGDPRALSADGRTLLVYGSTFTIRNKGVYLVPVDGSAPARRISPPLEPGGNVFTGAFTPDGNVLYLLSGSDGASELYVTDLDSIPPRPSGPPR